MIIYHLKDLMLKKAATSGGKKITYEDIEAETGISKVTLSRIASKRGYYTGMENIEKLCIYFDCTPDQLMTIIPDPTE